MSLGRASGVTVSASSSLESELTGQAGGDGAGQMSVGLTVRDGIRRGLRKEPCLVKSEQEIDQEVVVSSVQGMDQGSRLRTGDPARSSFAQSVASGAQVDQVLNKAGS